MTKSEKTRETRSLLGRCAAGISTCTLGITVAAMAMAQQQNIYEKPSGSRFKAAPRAPDADSADAAGGSIDMIFGIPANTIFFVAVAAFAVFWFTFGGGRKPKITGQQS